MSRIDGPSGSKIQDSHHDTGSANRGAVDNRDADSFKKSVGRRDERGGGRGGEEGNSKDPLQAAKEQAKKNLAGDKPAQRMSPGAAMLKNMGSGDPAQNQQIPGQGLPPGQMQNAAVQASGPLQPSARADGVNELVKSVADQIMVGAKGSAGEGEVRIQLKGDVLDGAEIRIKQDGGRLEITFVTKSADAHNFLNTRAGEFRSELGNRMERDIVVNVETQDDMDQQEQRDRRSAQEYVGDDEDEDT